MDKSTIEVDSLLEGIADLSKVLDYKRVTLHVNKCRCNICPTQNEKEAAFQTQLTDLIDRAKQYKQEKQNETC